MIKEEFKEMAEWKFDKSDPLRRRLLQLMEARFF